jgi:hypothetical protein
MTKLAPQSCALIGEGLGSYRYRYIRVTLVTERNEVLRLSEGHHLIPVNLMPSQEEREVKRKSSKSFSSHHHISPSTSTQYIIGYLLLTNIIHHAWTPFQQFTVGGRQRQRPAKHPIQIQFFHSHDGTSSRFSTSLPDKLPSMFAICCQPETRSQMWTFYFYDQEKQGLGDTRRIPWHKESVDLQKPTVMKGVFPFIKSWWSHPGPLDKGKDLTCFEYHS